jgi:hypothetical protein
MNSPWLQTRSGRAFPLINPEPSEVHWPDIVFALSHINRFGGHVGTYSVAQHSILVADQLRPEWRIYGLLHDAHEAFVGDFPTPLKCALDDRDSYTALRYIAEDIDRAILLAADCCYPVPEEIADAVHIADRRALLTERRDLMANPPHSWGPEYDNVIPLPERIVRCSPEWAMRRFGSALAGSGLTIPSLSSIA